MNNVALKEKHAAVACSKHGLVKYMRCAQCHDNLLRSYHRMKFTLEAIAFECVNANNIENVLESVKAEAENTLKEIQQYDNA